MAATQSAPPSSNDDNSHNSGLNFIPFLDLFSSLVSIVCTVICYD